MMKIDNIKGKKYNITIKGIVIHKVKKEAHKTSCSLDLAKKEISPTEKETTFVVNIKDAYYKKLSPTYGIFGDGDKKFQNLDFSKIDVACLINITKWQNITNNQDNNSKTYLSFVRGNKDVSLYFMKFINCSDNTTSAESTKRLVQTLDTYCRYKKYDRNISIQKKNVVFEYCTNCITNKKEIQLSAISALLDNENPNEFKEYASQEDNGVSEIISGDKTQLRKMRYTYYKSDNLTIIFDNNELDKTVFYDKQTKQLIFRKLPEKLIKELEK